MFIPTKGSTSKKQQVSGKTGGETQQQEDAQAQGKLRNSGNEVARGKLTLQQKSHYEQGRFYWQDGIIWQGRRAKTRCISRGSKDWMAAGVPRQPRWPSPSQREEQRGREKQAGQKHTKHRTLTRPFQQKTIITLLCIKHYPLLFTAGFLRTVYMGRRL